MWNLVMMYRLPYSQLSLILTGSKRWRCVKYSLLQRSLSYEHIKNLIFWHIPFFYKIKNRDEMEKRTETGLVMGHAYGVTAVKKVTSTFYLMVIGYSWSSSSSFKVLFTMMVNNTSKEKYNHFSHDVVTSDLSGLRCFNSILPVFFRQWGWTNKCSNPYAVVFSCDWMGFYSCDQCILRIRFPVVRCCTALLLLCFLIINIQKIDHKQIN